MARKTDVGSCPQEVTPPLPPPPLILTSKPDLKKRSRRSVSSFSRSTNKPSVSSQRSKSANRVHDLEIESATCSPLSIAGLASIPSSAVVTSAVPISSKKLDMSRLQVANPVNVPLLTKKLSSPVCMASRSLSMATGAAITPLTVVAKSSSTKFSTSEAETIVMANNQSGGNLRNSFYQQLSYSPTIVNTCGRF